MAGLQDYVKPEELKQAATASTTATNTANEYAIGAATLPIKLKEALMEHYNYNQDILKKQSEATTGALTAFTRGNDMYKDVFDPFVRDKLISQYRAQEFEPLNFYNNLLTQRGQNISDVISNISPIANVVAKTKEMQASKSNNLFDNLFKIYQQGEQERQFNEQEARMGSKSGGLSTEEAMALIEGMYDTPNSKGLVDLYPGMGAGTALNTSPTKDQVKHGYQVSVPDVSSILRYKTLGDASHDTEDTDGSKGSTGLNLLEKFVALKSLKKGDYSEALKILKPASVKLSSVDRADLSRNQSALQALIELEKIVRKDPYSLGKAALPFDQEGRMIASYLSNVIDTTGTNRTGAAYTTQQRGDYANLGPRFPDDKDTALAKIASLRKEFNDRISGLNSGGSSEEFVSTSGKKAYLEF